MVMTMDEVEDCMLLVILAPSGTREAAGDLYLRWSCRSRERSERQLKREYSKRRRIREIHDELGECDKGEGEKRERRGIGDLKAA